MKKPRDLKIIMIPIDDIKPTPENERLHPDENIEILEKGLKEFDQQKPIVIDMDNNIVTGHGIYAAAKKAGFTHWNCSYTNLKGNKKKAYRVFDNKSSELSKWDDERLGKTLYDLHQDDYSMIDYGFDEKIRDDEFEFKPPNENSNSLDKYELKIICKNEEQLDDIFVELNDRGFEVKRT